MTRLTPAAQYTFCLIAKNTFGKTPGSAESFTTAAAVLGLTACAPSGETSKAATLEASLQPEGFLTEYYFQYGTSVSYESSSKVKASESSGVVTTSELLTGLEPHKVYDCRLAATRKINGEPFTTYGESGTFQTSAVKPAVADEWTSSVSATSAVLDSSISPENSPTGFYVEYVDAANYHGESSEPYQQGLQGRRAPASGEVAVGENIAYNTSEVRLEGLAPGVTYHYRVVANDSVGTTYGADETLTTVPVLEPSVSAIAQTGATLSASVDPEGLETSWTFEYGTSTEYGMQVSGVLGAGTQPQTVSAALQGLTPDSTYHFRLWSNNAHGSSYSADETFTTQSTAVLPPQPFSLSPALALPTTPPLLGTPAIAFPLQTNSIPPPSKLEEALKACEAKPKSKRAACERQAHRKYGTRAKKKRRIRRKALEQPRANIAEAVPGRRR